MLAAELNRRVEDRPDNLPETRLAIGANVPVGTHVHDDVVARDRAKRLERGLARILERAPALASGMSGTRMDRMFRSLGTLGGGNHFLEIQRSAAGAVWLMLHSGSRGIGSRIGLHFIAEAKERIEREGIDPRRATSRGSSQPNIERMLQLGLCGIAEALAEQREVANIEQLGFDDRLAIRADLDFMSSC